VTMWVTETLAEYISCLRPEDVTPGAKEMAKRCVLDLVGAAVAGFESCAAHAVRTALTRHFADGPSTVWFSHLLLDGAAAAMINSAAASALDLDDGHRAAGGHPGASIIPAAVAIAEEVGATAEELLAAIVTGYEVGIRVAAARDFAALDTLSTGRWCAYGAAAAGGFLRKMPPHKIAQALAIAGVQAPGLSASGYSSVMGNHVKEGIPWSTLTGLVALDLAADGFTGPTDILDHPSYYDREKIVADLGSDFAIERVYFKPYSCCRWSHSAVDALLGLLAEHDIDPKEIHKVDVYTFGRALRLNNSVNPDSLEGAQYSVPFALAVAALRGERALLPLRTQCLGEPDLIDFAKKITLHIDPDLDRSFPARTPARVLLRTTRGDYERLVVDALGDPANPLDRSKLEFKFRTLTSGAMSSQEQEAMITALTDLETGGYARFLEILRKPGAQHG
jgi:2-methylcitrate dehydratase PrpD